MTRGTSPPPGGTVRQRRKRREFQSGRWVCLVKARRTARIGTVGVGLVRKLYGTLTDADLVLGGGLLAGEFSLRDSNFLSSHTDHARLYIKGLCAGAVLMCSIAYLRHWRARAESRIGR